jgi:MFS family permease
VFRALRHPAYRWWFSASLIANVGTWMQLTAQDWIVLTVITDHDAVAVGAVMALQLGPQLALLPFTGWIADHLDRRTVLLVTQSVLACAALVVGALVLFGDIRLWHVLAAAAVVGSATAVDGPSRQAHIRSLIGTDVLTSAISLGGAAFNLARMIGPALAGVLIDVIGPGWVIALNGVTYGAAIAVVAALRTTVEPAVEQPVRGLFAGVRVVRRRSDLALLLLAVFLVGTFGMNFPIHNATMATQEFGASAAAFGLLSSLLATGAVIGALLAGWTPRPRIRVAVAGSALFGAACAAGAVAPSLALYGALLVAAGIGVQSLTTASASIVQLTVPHAVRGRVLALHGAAFLGGTPLGAPLAGLIADTLGPRAGLLVAAASGLLATAAAVGWYAARRRRA